MADQKTQEERQKEFEENREKFDAIENARGSIIIKFTDEGAISQIDLKEVTPMEAISVLRGTASSLLVKVLFGE